MKTKFLFMLAFAASTAFAGGFDCWAPKVEGGPKSLSYHSTASTLEKAASAVSKKCGKDTEGKGFVLDRDNQVPDFFTPSDHIAMEPFQAGGAGSCRAFVVCSENGGPRFYPRWRCGGSKLGQLRLSYIGGGKTKAEAFLDFVKGVKASASMDPHSPYYDQSIKEIASGFDPDEKCEAPMTEGQHDAYLDAEVETEKMEIGTGMGFYMDRDRSRSAQGRGEDTVWVQFTNGVATVSAGRNRCFMSYENNSPYYGVLVPVEGLNGRGCDFGQFSYDRFANRATTVDNEGTKTFWRAR